jgi:hypothetical protein
MDMFSKATAEATDTTTKKSDKKIITVSDVKFDKNLQKLAQLKVQMDALTTQMDLVKSELNPMATDIFNKEYEKMGCYPESFLIVTKSGANGTWVPQDKYKKLTKDSFNFLMGKYGTEIVSDEIEFTLDKDLVQAHGKEISDLIQKSKLPKEVKDGLIKAKSTKAVIKGSISKALTFGKGLDSKHPVSVSEFIGDIEPTMYFLNPKLG